MDLSSILKIVIKKKKVIVVIASTTALMVFLIGLFLVKYEVSATILIKPLGIESERNIKKAPIGMVFSPYLEIINKYGNTYVNILKSRKLIEKVVAHLELDKAYSIQRSHFAHFIDMVKQPLRFIKYGRLPAVKQSPLEKAIKKTIKQVEAVFIVKSSIIRLTVKNDDAHRAAAIANTLFDIFVEYSRSNKIQSAETTKAFLRQQLEITRARLKKQRERLKELKKKYGIYVFSDFQMEENKLSTKLEASEEQYEQNNFQIQILKDYLERIKKEIKKYPGYKIASYKIELNKTLLNLKNTLFNLKTQLYEMLIDYTPNSPQVKGLKDQIALTENAINSEIELILSSKVVSVNPAYQDMVNQKIHIEVDLSGLPYLNKQIWKRIELYRERLIKIEEIKTKISEINLTISSLKVHQESEFLNAFNMADVLKNRGFDEIEILDKAVVPRYPVLRGIPLSIYVFIGFFSGLILGAGLTVLIEQLRRMS